MFWNTIYDNMVAQSISRCLQKNWKLGGNSFYILNKKLIWLNLQSVVKIESIIINCGEHVKSFFCQQFQHEIRICPQSLLLNPRQAKICQNFKTLQLESKELYRKPSDCLIRFETNQKFKNNIKLNLTGILFIK